MSKTLKYINTSYIQLPELPSSLEELYCDNNSLLKELPELPSGLKYLYCNNNLLLTELPELPSNLKHFYCYNNKLLERLPELPYNLKILYCNNNPLLTTLPRSIIYCKNIIYDYNNNNNNNYKKYNDLKYLNSLPYLVNKIIEDYYYKPIMYYYNSKFF